MSNYKVAHADGESGGLVKMWENGVVIDNNARQQLRNVASLPFIYKWVAAMPDAHWGMGATVGSVIATKKAIIPAAVGVDLGCGMMAVRTDMSANNLPDNLSELRSAIERAVPHGGPGVKGSWKERGGNIPTAVLGAWAGLRRELESDIFFKNPLIRKGLTVEQLGTLGTGNHFIELCLDEKDRVWMMLHSGSRGIGNRLASFFIQKAKKDMERWFISLPDKDLAYIPEGSNMFDDYWQAVSWAQRFAFVNRQIMMDNVHSAIRDVTGQNVQREEEAINCHHNYVARENHYGENVWVTRKGAVSAREGDMGIIPGSMGARSYIVRGLGNPESFYSCSHGAGRVMSRNEARKRITVEDHIAATQGVECRKDSSVVDESPAAYKDIDAVMRAQSDLVQPVHTLKQVLCVKG